MRSFVEWLESEKDAPSFPIQEEADFMDWLQAWLLDGRFQGVEFDHWIGVSSDDDGSNPRVNYLAVAFASAFDSSKSAGQLEWHDIFWRDKIHEINAAAPASCNKAVQASDVWVRMRVESAFIDGVIYSYATSCSCVFLALIVFTRNFKMAAISVWVIICIVVLMMAALIENGLKLGAIEAISLQKLWVLPWTFCSILHTPTLNQNFTRPSDEPASRSYLSERLWCLARPLHSSHRSAFASQRPRCCLPLVKLSFS
jgi:hypothetical protein